MDALLRWGIENSSNDTAAPTSNTPKQPLDPAIIDAILGKSDADHMKQNLSVAVDETNDLDNRITALDNFEMLVEQIDNANNLTPLKMWETLIQLSKSAEDEIKQYGLWILGTAIQNNPKAQQSYLSHNPLPYLISVLDPEKQESRNSSAATRSKAIYCISNSLRHNARAVQGFDSLGGWKILALALQDSSVVVRRKAAFLLLTLLLQDGPSSSKAEPVQLPPSIHTNLPAPVPEIGETETDGLASRGIASSGILKDLLRALVSPIPHGPNGDAEPDLDLEEKSVKVILAFVRLGVIPLEQEDRELLAKVLNKVGKASGLERWSLTIDEWEDLEKASKL